MRISLLPLILSLGVGGARAAVKPSAYLSISAGETVRQINNSDSPLTGIYHAGVKGTLASKYWELGVLMEAGVFNRHPSLGSVGEAKVHYPLFQEDIRLGVGGGVDFQSYFRGNYRRQFETTQEYTYRIVPMVIGQVLVFKRTFLEYQGNFDDEIFWKFRIGCKVWG